jgi:hypothetical protein
VEPALDALAMTLLSDRRVQTFASGDVKLYSVRVEGPQTPEDVEAFYFIGLECIAAPRSMQGRLFADRPVGLWILDLQAPWPDVDLCRRLAGWNTRGRNGLDQVQDHRAGRRPLYVGYHAQVAEFDQHIPWPGCPRRGDVGKEVASR